VPALQDLDAQKRRCEELEAALSRSEAKTAAERERAQKHERDATLLREVLYETLLHGGNGASASAQSAAEHLQGASLTQFSEMTILRIGALYYFFVASARAQKAAPCSCAVAVRSHTYKRTQCITLS
jgi:hypothetical protein